MKVNKTVRSHRAKNSTRVMENGAILVVQTGFQDDASTMALHKDIQNAIEQVHKEGRKPVILIDFSRVTGYDEAAQRNGGEMIRDMDYHALAFYGARDKDVDTISTIIQDVGQSERAATFKDVHEASLWVAGHIIGERY